jgi:hypothetical protein
MKRLTAALPTSGIVAAALPKQCPSLSGDVGNSSRGSPTRQHATTKLADDLGWSGGVGEQGLRVG